MSSKVSPHSSALGNSSSSGNSTSGGGPRRHLPNRTTTTGGAASSSSTAHSHAHPHSHHHKLGGKKRKTAGGGAKLRMGLGIPSTAAVDLAAAVAGRLAAETSATTLPAPPSSPVPPDEEEDLDGDLDIEEIDVEDEDVLEEEEEDDSEDLEDEEDDEEEDEELIMSGAPTASVRHRRPHHLHHPPRGDESGDPVNAAYNSPIFLGSTSDEEDEDEEDEDDEDEDGGEVDESLERDESDEDEEEDDDGLEPQEFLLQADDSSIQGIPPDAQARLEAFFEAAGFTDGKAMSDPESLRKLTLTVSSALGEASAAINRMRDSQRKSIEEGRNDSMEEGDSLLALACSSGYFELARVLLAMGANVDDRGSKGDLTPLMDAASQGHLEIVRLLLSHGAEVNAQSACGNSPLMYACAAGHEEVVHELLKTGANVEDNNENGHTPLMEAASAGHVGVAKILLEHGAGINTHSNEFKESALTVACYKGHLDMVRFLLDAGADQQHKTDEMHTALMEASMDGHVEVARLLLDSGAQVNMPADSFESPLTLAACGGHVDLAELLVERGANIEEVNDEGYTPLMEASREGHIAVVQSLLRNGALINAQTEETHETALTLGACGGFLDVVDTLCKSGADIELGASTPLMEASQEGHIQVVKYLLERGIDIHRQTQSGDTALSYACENGHLEVAELLVEMGANAEHLSEGGRTPIMKACRGGHVEVIKFLLDKGADVNRQTTSNDHTSLSLACAGGHLASVELLLAAGANPYHKLKDNSTMIIEAARGGHTTVIRALLDYAPPNSGKNQTGAGNNEKTTQQAGKQGLAGKLANTAGKNQKAVAPDSGKTGPNQAVPAKNIMSVLRKSRSTSTLDSAPQQSKESLGLAEGIAKTTVQQHPLPEQPIALPKNNSGKNVNTVDTTAVDKPLSSQNLSTSKLSDKKVGLTVTDGAAPSQPLMKPSSSTPDTPLVGSCKNNIDGLGTNEASQIGLCTECTKGVESQVQVIASVTPGPGQVNVKRPAGTDPLLTAAVVGASLGTTTTPGVIIPVLAPMSTAAVPVGPPLVPSQVTAATAISERPKAKANKPSARKQVQLQQQGQGGNSTVTSPGGTSDKSQTSPMGSPNSSSSGLSPGSVAISTSSAPTSPGNIKVSPPNSSSSNPAPTNVNGSSAVLQMQIQQVKAHPITNTHLKLDPKQLTQILAQHQQQFLNYKGDKSKPGAFPLAASNGQSSMCPNGPGAPVSNGTTTTTTTTTVVVTHGNGEMETIIEGENLMPGTNEMILSAAAAAFPLECFPMPSARQLNPSSGVHVQSYQMSSPGSDLTPGTLTSTTMQTTTIINSAGGNFPPQMLLPHPPPLPAAIAAAAAAAGVVPPSGAPPPGALKGVAPTTLPSSKGKEPQAPLPQKTGAAGAAKTLTPVSASAGPTVQPAPVPVPPVASVAGIQSVKKQLAKRSRPFGQPTQGAQQPRQSNQQTQTHTHTHGHTHQMKQNHSVASTQTTLTSQQGEKAAAVDKNSGVLTKHFDVDCSTESGGETSLSVAAAAGHLETVEFLLARKAHIEHRDKKGCTPIILAADAGYDKVVELLITHGSDIEAQSERTKDTALSLACTKGRFEVVELLLKKGANKEHRNVSDYTPLSLAASGGYVNVIKLLLQHGAEINSRTGSKLGISPLMLAAMNGNTAAVKLLLDMGSDINAQIETNKNTALTLACFQGRHEVVSLLLDRKANLEHRAKTGLTPLMEAANGGYTEVGKTLLDRGADVNAAPVPATKDTALTIAADKGHYRFVELLLQRGAMVEVRNKKGCTPIWLACHGGHADVVQILFRHGADLDVQDNRKVSCLMAAFRKGHVKVIRWVVKNVQQFPSDVEMSRYYASIQSEADLLKRCQQCADFVKQAKDKQALEANKNASILLEELDMEKSREELKRQAAARRREKKKKKKQEKKRGSGSKDDDDDDENDDDDQEALQEEEEDECANVIDSGIDANSLGSNSSAGELRNNASRNKSNKENLNNEIVEPEARLEQATVTLSSTRHRKKKNKKKDKLIPPAQIPEENPEEVQQRNDILREKESKIAAILEEVKIQGKVRDKRIKKEAEEFLTSHTAGLKGVQTNTGISAAISSMPFLSKKSLKISSGSGDSTQSTTSSVTNTYHHPEPLMGISLNPSHLRKAGASNFDSHCHDMSLHSQHHNFQISYATSTKLGVGNSGSGPGSQSGCGKGGRKDDGWKEVTRNCPSSRSKKVIVPSSVISRVIGRGGCNINAIREATGAHIEVEKQQKGQVQPERTIQIKGSVDSTKQAHTLITNLMNEPDLDIKKLLAQCLTGSAWTGAAPTTSAVPIPIVCRTQNVIVSQACLSQESNHSNQPVSLIQMAGAVAAAGGKPKTTSSKIPSSPPNISSISPPIKKPTTPTQGTGISVFKGTTNSGVVKKSLVFTPSSNAVAATTNSSLKNCQTSFASKLVQQQGIVTQQTTSVGMSNIGTTSQHLQQRNTTPTPTKPVTPPFNNTSRSTPTSTPPPLSSSPGLSNGSMSLSMNMTSNQLFGKSSVRPIAPPSQGKERNCNQMTGNGKAFGQLSQPMQQTTLLPNTSLTPPAQGALGNPTNTIFQPRTATECRTDSDSPQMSHQTPPLEYSPFSYHFSKATPWFPADLGHNTSAMLASSDNSAMSGMHTGPGSSLGQLGSNPNLLTGSSSASRAMNFASVAASGISTTTTAQMTQAGGIHNGLIGPGVVPNLGIAPIGTTSNLKNVSDGLLDNDMPKVQADASKAPGYRGSNMGSPVLRMQQQQPQVQSGQPIGNFGMENSVSSHYSAPPSGMTSLSQGATPGLMSFNPTSSPRHMNMNNHSGVGVNGPGFGLGLGHHGQQEMQNPGPGVPQQTHFSNSGGLPGGPPPTTNASSGVPTNVIISSRLNPRAPSFQLPQAQKMNSVGGQQQPNVTNYQPPGQQQFNSIHQQPQQYPAFKMGPMNQFSGRSNNNMAAGGRQPVNAGMNVIGPGWNSYSQDASMFDLQGLAALASTSGAIDPQALLSGMENPLHDNQNSIKLGDRRLPRAIGEERSWKNTGTSNLGNIGPFGSIECLEPSQMSQGVFQQSQPIQTAQHHQQTSNWMGMYGGSNPQQFQGSSMPQPPPHANVNTAPIPQRGNDSRGFLGRRFIEEVDQNRILELQQMYDGRLMNGGGVPPALMHITPGGPQMYPFGVEVDHVNQHVPKVDQHNNSWGDNSHLLMDDKHNMGWGAKWGN